MPIPLPLLLEEPETSEIKCPIQFAMPQKSLPGILLPLSSNFPSELFKDISSPSDIKSEVFVNWLRIEKNKPNKVGLCPSDLK